jgi:hypothetical protein
VVLRAIPIDHEGGAAGVLVTTQQVAGAIGIALSGILFFGLLHQGGAPPYADSFAVALCFNVVLFLVTAVMVPVLRHER